MRKCNYFMLGLTVLVWGALANAADPGHRDYASTARAIVAEFTQRQTAAFDRAVDPDAIITSALADLAMDAAWKQGISQELNSVIRTKLGPKLISQMPEGAYAKLVRTRVDGQKTLALMRIDYGDNGTGYLDMHLVRDKNGMVRIVDWYDYSTGQLYTQSLRQLIGLMSPTPTILGKLFDAVSRRKESINAVMELISLHKSQKYPEAVKLFLTLHEDLRKDRMLNIVAVQAANMSNDDALYHKTLANLDRYFSSDPSMAFLLIDYYFLEQKFDKALAALDQVQKSFGAEDAALDSLKANTHLSAKNYSQAARHAQHAIAIEPEYEGSYWSLINALVQDKKYAGAITVAKDLEDGFGYDMGPESLGASAVFEPFIQSAEYRRWRSAK